MKGTGPPERRRLVGCLPDNRLDTATHLLCRSAGESEKEYSLRICAGHDEVRHAMSQGTRLARAGSGYHQQRFGGIRPSPMLYSLALCNV
jgi:hypothetical protein